MRSKRALPLAFSLWSSIALVSAIDFYVSPSGSDSNDGSSGRPFQALPKAQQAVREAISSSLTEDVTVHLADGIYTLSEPLILTAADSGNNGHSVNWKADSTGATISGGLKLTNWTAGSDGIYSAPVPPGTKSRNLYVNGQAVNYARRKITRNDFTYDNEGMSWNNTAYDYLMSIRGIGNAEVRFLNSFTDRYAPIESASNQKLMMKQNSWANNIIGYDTVQSPFAEFGVWVQNSYDLFTDGGQFFLDTDANIIYYKPQNGEDMSQIDAHLGILEVLLAVGGTYDAPAHHIFFENINFAHSTWLRPGEGFGYVDQQTGGYIPGNITYPEFEASRQVWFQMPSAIQVSAANHIGFSGGRYTQLGAGGLGIGNDANAHQTGVGLGADRISITGGYFTQVMGNSITAGGNRPDAHHPSDARMLNAHISVQDNIFYNTSSLFTSTVPIFFTYVQNSDITHNDISFIPYSGICLGYGWGMQDAGGSQFYVNRGTYKYFEPYTTPTTSLNNSIHANLIHGYGYSKTDLAGIYTLSKSAFTTITENYAYDSLHYGLYTDEGSNSYTITGNNFLPEGNWYNPNQGAGMQTANNTLIDNFGARGRDFLNSPNGSGIWGNTFLRNYIVPNLSRANIAAARIAYRSGIEPSKRAGRSISHSVSLADGALSLEFLTGNGDVVLNLFNFDDAEFTGVQISVGSEFTAENVPTAVPANGVASATYKLAGSSCTPPRFSATVRYTNSRTGAAGSLEVSGTMPGSSPTLNSTYVASSTWPATFGQSCDVIGIRTAGRDAFDPYDEWAAVYRPASITGDGSITARVLSVDIVDPWTKAGIVMRNNLTANNGQPSTAAGYAAVFLTGSNGVSFQWDANGNGQLDGWSVVADIVAPVCLRLNVTGQSFSGYYANDCTNWRQIGSAATASGRGSSSDAGLLVSSHASFVNATALFSFEV
ncbi:hypothetical protein IAQ61_009087 [Plenodomus lingam]|uniref:Right handed beta helix domain-containing protein n=1 Tax=Leptosphaeria maculans (strain JN3 / isolate v23.1.3 / race Av1-4-5-6-7-8) TaxID=985895 RepID=E4ZP25_LEPMJ|nr:hypothetical protein LEMA_P042950.1 [Plenodomus lingam JN3]KAH9865140.1 hypothetical protein IAQ61_009087 [Plenodomus lingam]CBX93394.1 hypothetical protein LEMA_P042950.1 [Plenodomus lingam JN3]